jgi:CRISPR-associated protein Cas1
MLIPLEGNYEQTKKMACQADASLPVKKQIWKTIVQAKLRSQAGVLRKRTGNDCGLLEMSKAVGSGDPGNLEAVAAARYWKQLLGNEFVRHNEDFRNSALNYGYAILRSIVARCLCASGLHPSLGVHHKNQRNPFCLADDVMEPFRPIVDNLIAGLKIQEQMTKETKQTILSGLMEKFGYMGERSTLFEIILRISQALAKHFTDGAPFDIGEISGYNVRLPE